LIEDVDTGDKRKRGSTHAAEHGDGENTGGEEMDRTSVGSGRNKRLHTEKGDRAGLDNHVEARRATLVLCCNNIPYSHQSWACVGSSTVCRGARIATRGNAECPLIKGRGGTSPLM
jgi:hypothetical protein